MTIHSSWQIHAISFVCISTVHQWWLGLGVGLHYLFLYSSDIFVQFTSYWFIQSMNENFWEFSEEQFVYLSESKKILESQITGLCQILFGSHFSVTVEICIQNCYVPIHFPPFQNKVQKALKRLDDVQEMLEKRHASLKKLSAKQTRPVQPVAPRPESSPKRPSNRTPQATGPGEFCRNQACVHRSACASRPLAVSGEIQLFQKHDLILSVLWHPH